MSTPLQGHLFKYKDKDGNWITIPILSGDIYTAYTEYCNANGLTPVSQHTYYETLGNLQSLVTELSGSTENIDALVTALGAEGALPQNMGGLGVSIPNENYGSLLAYLASIGVAKNEDLEVLNTALEDAIDNLGNMINKNLSKSDVAWGTGAPDPNSPALFYFQHS